MYVIIFLTILNALILIFTSDNVIYLAEIYSNCYVRKPGINFQSPEFVYILHSYYLKYM